MVFDSFNQTFSAEKGKIIILALSVAFVVCMISFLLGKVIYNRCPASERCIMQYGTLVSNAGFAGLPLISSAYGAEALFIASIYIIPTRIFMWSAGISLFTDAPFKTKFKNVMLNPGIIAVELGLVRMLLNIELPSVINTAIKNIGGCTSAMSMIIVGAILAEVDIKTVISKNVLYLVFIRQLLLPFLVLVAMKTLGMDYLLTCVAVILTGMPVGSTTAILAQKYGADYKFGSKCVFMSTVLSLITVPILALFL